MTKPPRAAPAPSGLPGSANSAQIIVVGYDATKSQACGFRSHPVCGISPRGEAPRPM
jgi:hypothetical protein